MVRYNASVNRVAFKRELQRAVERAYWEGVCHGFGTSNDMIEEAKVYARSTEEIELLKTIQGSLNLGREKALRICKSKKLTPLNPDET